MGNSRRTFIKQAAGFTTACFTDFVVESAAYASSSLASDSIGGVSMGWYERPMRWAQLAFVEDDPGNYDLSFWLDYFQKIHADAACLSAGGVVAFYPTEIPLHYRSRWLGTMDTFGEIVAGCRKLGMNVIARTDSHACHQDVYDAHPDWIAVDEHGNVVDAHKIFAVLLKWLLERKKWPGDVTRAFNTTKMLDRICVKYGRRLHEHGIGFKYVCDLMLEQEILIGGEESGGIGISRHLPERDGLLNSLLLANVMADEKKTLGELVAALQEEFGEHQYGRVDMHIDEALKQSAIARAKAGVADFAGMKVLRVETLDGIKFFLDNPGCAPQPNAAETWILLRASGTEPLLRVYCESCSVESVARVLDAAQAFVLKGSAV